MFVLTHRPPAEPPAGVTFVGDLHSAVAQATEAAGDKDYVNILGANVAKQCIEAGLLDDGVRMFDHPGGTNVRLALIPGETAQWHSVIH